MEAPLPCHRNYTILFEELKAAAEKGVVGEPGYGVGLAGEEVVVQDGQRMVGGVQVGECSGVNQASVGDVCVGNDLPHVTVFAVEVEPTSLVKVVDLAICPRAGTASEGDALVLDALENGVELFVGS